MEKLTLAESKELHNAQLDHKLLDAYGLAPTSTTPEEHRAYQAAAELVAWEADKARQKKHRDKIKALDAEIDAELTEEDLAAWRKVKAARAQARRKRQALLEAQLTEEEREQLAADRAAQARTYYLRKKQKENLLPEEEREALAAERKERANARYRARAEANRLELAAKGLPTPKRGRKPLEAPTEKQLRNREAQRRFTEKRRSET